jgi:hypothetical protein
MEKWSVLSLDVWGHGPAACEQWGCKGDCEGYTVNDVRRAGEG